MQSSSFTGDEETEGAEAAGEGESVGLGFLSSTGGDGGADLAGEGHETFIAGRLMRFKGAGLPRAVTLL